MVKPMQQIVYKKYIIVFLITLGIFGVAFLLSNFIYQKKIETITSLEDQISLNILSSEVQSSLISELPCEASSTPILSEELNELSEQLTFMETERGADNPEVQQLKTRYSLLEIKDYLFTKAFAARCGQKPKFILYFYSNAGDCKNCLKEGYVLTRLQNEFPDLKIYSFDYGLPASGIRSLISIYKIKNTLPALVIDRNVYYGFKNFDEIVKLMPSLKRTSSLKN